MMITCEKLTSLLGEFESMSGRCKALADEIADPTSLRKALLQGKKDAYADATYRLREMLHEGGQ